jgi:hypothetical protein
MSALLQQVGDLPQRAVIYYLTLQEDADGTKFNGADALSQPALVANRPIYTWLYIYLGNDTIGGSILSNDVLARAVGDVALRVLQGEPPDRIPVHQIDPNVDAFDWRELRRFGATRHACRRGASSSFGSRARGISTSGTSWGPRRSSCFRAR